MANTYKSKILLGTNGLAILPPILKNIRMLFGEDHKRSKGASRPALPNGIVIDYEIGFLFNFASAKSTRFDLEPILLYKRDKFIEYKRVSLQVDRGLAYLQPLDDEFYQDLIQFSDSQLLKWMTGTGNRFIQNNEMGSWAHASVRELKNLRKHYLTLLQKLWTGLCSNPTLFGLHNGRFVGHSQQSITLGRQPAEIRFLVEQEKDAMVLTMILLLDGKEAKVNLLGGILL